MNGVDVVNCINKNYLVNNLYIGVANVKTMKLKKIKPYLILALLLLLKILSWFITCICYIYVQNTVAINLTLI